MNRSLYRNPLDLSNSVDYESMKRNGFHDQDILVVHLDDDRIGWIERQMLVNVGEKLYGKRGTSPEG